MALENVTYFYISGAETGYVVVPLLLVAGALASLRSRGIAILESAAWSLAERPLEDESQWKKVQFTVSIAPAAPGAGRAGRGELARQIRLDPAAERLLQLLRDRQHLHLAVAAADHLHADRQAVGRAADGTAAAGRLIAFT